MLTAIGNNRYEGGSGRGEVNKPARFQGICIFFKGLIIQIFKSLVPKNEVIIYYTKFENNIPSRFDRRYYL